MSDLTNERLSRDLPRSRALMRLDGAGHIMPVEPVTPAGSRAWHLVHLPIVLAGLATGVLVLTAVAVRALGSSFAGHLPGARYALVIAGTAIIAWLYWAFGRFLERRPVLQELEPQGAPQELIAAYLGGFGIPLAVYAVLLLAGALHPAGYNPIRGLITPLVVQSCVGIVLGLIICGVAFRLVERWLGSWLTVAAAMIAFAGTSALTSATGPADALPAALKAVILVAGPFMATRRLWAAIGIRAGLGFGTVVFNGSAMSITGPQGLFLSTIGGPDWLTGGSAGVDASAPALCVDLLVAAMLLAVAVRRGRIVRPAWLRGRAG